MFSAVSIGCRIAEAAPEIAVIGLTCTQKEDRPRPTAPSMELSCGVAFSGSLPPIKEVTSSPTFGIRSVTSAPTGGCGSGIISLGSSGHYGVRLHHQESQEWACAVACLPQDLAHTDSGRAGPSPARASWSSCDR